MTLKRIGLVAFVAMALPCFQLAAATPAMQDHVEAELAARQLEQDPFAQVYVVTSRETYDGGLKTLAASSVSRRDSRGQPLVVSRLQAHQLDDLSRHIHENEKRCGGYFAFDTQAEADAFIRNDRTAQMLHATLVAYTIDNASTVNPWLGAVDANNIKSTISHLSSYTNRYYTSTTGRSSAEWIRNTWAGLANGRADVTTELSACGNCSTQPSVILTIQGTELPGEIMVLGAHLDSISSGTSPTQVAPGADDDASGIATLTEVIRIALASGWQPKRTVKFMGYAAEEVGLRGSNAIAQSMQSSGANIVGVLQMDMTNYQTGATEMRLVTDNSNAAMKQFLTDLFDAYLLPTGIQRGTYTCGYGCSDHASWTSAGYPAAMMFEGGTSTGGYNPNIHSPNDTLANMGNSAAPSVHFAKLGLAFLGELGKTSGGGGNANPVANFSSSANGLTVAFTDTSTDADGTIASRSWNFGDGTTSTATNPNRTYAAAGTYSVSLTVTDDGGAANTKTSAVTVTSTPGGNVLTNGVPRTGLSGAAGSSQYFTLAVPAGATNLRFVTSGGTGDLDLYARFGSQPTTTVNDCKSEGSANAETCTIVTAQAGTYHLLVRAYSAYSGASLTGSYSTGGGGGSQTYTNGTDYTINDNATVDSPIIVSGRSGNGPASASVNVNIVHTYKGDLKVDLVAPDGTLYNIHNRSGGSADNVIGTFTRNLTNEALNGTWKLRVNDNAGGDVGYINSWSVTF